MTSMRHLKPIKSYYLTIEMMPIFSLIGYNKVALIIIGGEKDAQKNKKYFICYLCRDGFYRSDKSS